MSSRSKQAIPRWLRLIALGLGIAVLVWLPIEDLDLRLVLVFSPAICAWLAARFLINLSPEKHNFIIRHIIISTLAGAAVAPLAVLLMVFKSGLHGHGTPDFSFEQIRQVLLQAPLWILAGILLGAGVAAARLGKRV